LVSDYLQIKAKLESENRTVGTLEHLALKDGKVNEQYPAVSTSRYAIHLEKWLKYFPLEQIHIGTVHYYRATLVNLINRVSTKNDHNTLFSFLTFISCHL